MKFRFTLLLSALAIPLTSLGLLLFAGNGIAHAAYNASYLISDKIFTDYSSMSAASIQSFLVSKNSGLQNVVDTEDCGSVGGAHYTYYDTYYDCGLTASAAKIIYDVSQAYQISPKAILATLQKEQSLVTTPNPTSGQINCAMGYNSCSGYSGFFSQVDNGAWQFRIDVEGSQHHTTWNGWSGIGGFSTIDGWYTGNCGTAGSLYSAGLYPGNQVTFYNPGGTAQTITIGNSATATLYCYTPYVGPYSVTGYSGSYNFVINFEQWFGSTSSPCYSDFNISGAQTGARVLPTKLGINHTDNLSVVQPNNTNTACLEDYTWKNGNYQAWQQLIASASPAIDPAASGIVSGDLNGDGIDEIYKVDYTGTNSGKIEIHGFTSNLQNFASHVATNSPSFSHSDSEVVACDPAGYGRDNLFLVEYRNTTSGDVEIHEWSTSFQQWVNHWDIGYKAVNPQNTQIICANLTPGSNKDAFYLVQYNSTGSGRLEVHGGLTNLPYVSPWPYASPASWPVHSATISGPRTHWEGSTSSSADDADVIAADTDGNGIDELYIVQYHGTNSGRIEIYGLSPGFSSYSMLTTTNQGQY